MKILTRKNTKNNAARLGDEALTDGSEETSVEIPNFTIAALGAFLTVILTLANGVSTLLREWVGAPKDKIAVEIQEGDYKLKVLKQALQNKNPQDRANSLKLLINAGLLKDSNGELMKYAGNPEQLPLWEQTSNTLQSTLGSVASPSTKVVPQSSSAETPVR